VITVSEVEVLELGFELYSMALYFLLDSGKVLLWRQCFAML
jgi:hypothetical protein